MAGGRPSAWVNQIKPNLDKIRKLRQRGYTEKQCAEAIGISHYTMAHNKKKYSELKQVLDKSKDELVLNAEDTLYKKALGGHTIRKIKRKYFEDENGNRIGGAEVTEEIYTAEPDTGSLVFMLTNLAPDVWKNKRDHEVSGGEAAKVVDKFFNAVVKGQSK